MTLSVRGCIICLASSLLMVETAVTPQQHLPGAARVFIGDCFHRAFSCVLLSLTMHKEIVNIWA